MTMKSKYNKDIRIILSQFKNNKKNTILEKAKQYKNRKLVCPNCRKPPGASFIETKDFYQAKCLASKPCQLNLQVKKFHRTLVTEHIEKCEADIQILKTRLINLHLYALYNVRSIDNILDEYEKLRKELYFQKKKYEAIISVYDSYVHKKRDETEIQEKQHILEDIIENIRVLLSDPTPSKIKETTELHAEILKLTSDIVKLKYPIQEIVKKTESSGYIESVDYITRTVDQRNIEVVSKV